jgi:PKD repeat protein
MKSYKIMIFCLGVLIAFLICNWAMALPADQWIANITCSAGNWSQNVTFGANDAGTDGYDAVLDILAPPAPPSPGTDVYFPVDDPIFDRFYGDIKYVVNAMNTERTWTLYVLSKDSDLNLAWDVAQIPANVLCILNVSNSDYDMKSVPSVTLTKSNSYYQVTITARYSLPISLIARFTANVTSGTTPLAVHFTDLSLNNPTGWAWFFGDENFTAPWTKMTASPGWTLRQYHTSVVMPDGSIVLMGGDEIEHGNIRMNDTWRSTDNGATWTQQTAHAGWSARHSHTSVVMPDGSIVLMGGYDGAPYFYSSRNDVWRSTDNGTTWTQQTAYAGWTAREGHSSVVMPDGSIVLMGGWDGYSWRVLNDVWRSSDNGATWTLMTASAGWSARMIHSSVAMPDGSIVLMGGDGSSMMNDTWRSTDNGATWTLQTAHAGWSARYGHSSVAMPDGSIVLMGGREDGNNSTVWRSTDNGATWTQLPDAGLSTGLTHSSVVMPDGSIVLIRGGMNDVWRFMSVGSSAQNPSHTYTAPGIYQVALQAYNAGGYNSTRKIGYITVTGLPMAQFILGRNAVYLTDGDMITRGNYTGDIRFDLSLFNENDASHTTLGNLMYELDADNITIPDWTDYAVWNATHAVWRFPSQYTIGENASFRTGILSNYTEGVSINVNMSRVCNQTLFNSTGYQLVTTTAEFPSVNASQGYWWRFVANPSGAVNPTFVPGSLVTDIPLRSVQTDQHYFHLELDANSLQPGFTYTTSCLVRVEPTGGLPVVYKPKIVIGHVLSQNTISGGVGYSVEMPAHLLPDHIHSASVSTNVSNAWTLTRLNQIFSVLQEVSEQQATSPHITLILPDISIPSGARKAAPIFIANVTNASGIRFGLTYNPAVIYITNLTANTSLTGATLEYEINNSTGSVNVSLTTTSPITTSTAIGIVNINVESKGSTGQQCALSTDFAEWTDPAFGAIPLSVRQGTVRIEGIRGDFNHNGRVDIGDVTRVAYMAVGLVPYDIQADFNGNEIVDSGDAAKIAWYYVGKINIL